MRASAKVPDATQFGAPSERGMHIHIILPRPKAAGGLPWNSPAEEAGESAAGREKRNELQYAREWGGAACKGERKGRGRVAGKDKEKRGGEGRLQTCQQPGQGEPRLLAPSHSHSFHKRRPNLRTSSQGEGASLQPGRSKFRTEAGRPVFQDGSDLGSKLVGLRR